jgi:hypothetical protein
LDRIMVVTWRTHGAFVALSFLAACTAAAPPPETPLALVADPPVLEHLDIFRSACLFRFPDDRAVAAKAAAEGWQPLNAQQISAMLHEDPGHGWSLTRTYGTYLLTIEEPPFHACVVRKVYPAVPDFQQPLTQMTGDWIAPRTPPQHVTPVPVFGNAAQTVYSLEIRGADGKVVEGIGAYVTRFANTPQVELRLARLGAPRN